jgi:hypothetical protein
MINYQQLEQFVRRPFFIFDFRLTILDWMSADHSLFNPKATRHYYRLPITDYRLPITDYRLPLTA